MEAMDITSVQVGSATREALAEYRDEHDHPNYNEALQDLLED